RRASRRRRRSRPPCRSDDGRIQSRAPGDRQQGARRGTNGGFSIEIGRPSTVLGAAVAVLGRSNGQLPERALAKRAIEGRADAFSGELTLGAQELDDALKVGFAELDAVVVRDIRVEEDSPNRLDVADR